MNLSDLPMDFSILHCNSTNTNLLSQFGEEEKLISSSEKHCSGTADPLSVFLRIRPFTEKETSDKSNISCIKVLNDSELVTLPPIQSVHRGVKKDLSDLQTLFFFTKIYDEVTGQKDFYDSAILDYISDFLKGHNVLIFAYGVSNAGKTYTMAGTRSSPGVLPRTMDTIFQAIEHQHSKILSYKPKGFSAATQLDKDSADFEELRKRRLMCRKLSRHNLISDLSKFSNDSDSHTSSLFATNLCDHEHNSQNHRNSFSINSQMSSCNEFSYSIWVSFVEIHNESIYDLLDVMGTHRSGLHTKAPLKLADDQNGNVYIKDIIEIRCNTTLEALHLFLLGEEQRQVAETNLNHNSSRSHVIFSLKCIRIDENGAANSVNSLCLVDLAGSERQIGAKTEGERLKEAGNINKSLLTLGRCIEIMRFNQRNSTAVQKIVPFRETKLTRLFQSYLIGRNECGFKGKITMIVNISQTASTFDETFHALKFSAVAKEIIPINIRIPRPISSVYKYSKPELYNFEETMNELNVSGMNIEVMDLNQMKDYCIDLERHNSSLIEMVVMLKEENLECEDRLRTELSAQFSHELDSLKFREASRRNRVENNLAFYHETRIDIIRNAISKEGGFRKRRSISLDSKDILLTKDFSIEQLPYVNFSQYAAEDSICDTSSKNPLNAEIREVSLTRKRKSGHAHVESGNCSFQDLQNGMREIKSAYESELIYLRDSVQELGELQAEVDVIDQPIVKIFQKEELSKMVKKLENYLSEFQRSFVKMTPKDLNASAVSVSTQTSAQSLDSDERECVKGMLKGGRIEFPKLTLEHLDDCFESPKPISLLEEMNPILSQSHEVDIVKLREESRSLFGKLTVAGNQNTALISKNSELSSHVQLLTREAHDNMIVMSEQRSKIELSDSKIFNLTEQKDAHFGAISRLKGELQSANEERTKVQTDFCVLEEKSAIYENKIKSLEQECFQNQSDSEKLQQMKSELIALEKQLLDARVTFMRKIRHLEKELIYSRQNSCSIIHNESSNVESPAPTSPRPSNLTYISMKENDFPLYESIHSSLFRESSSTQIPAPKTDTVCFCSEYTKSQTNLIIGQSSPTTAETAKLSVEEDSFDSYPSSKVISDKSSGPVYENISCIFGTNSEYVEPYFSNEYKEELIKSIKPAKEVKRKSRSSLNTSTKKRNRINKFAGGSVTFTRSSRKNSKTQKKCQEQALISLPSKEESCTPKKRFQFFGTSSLKKFKSVNATENVSKCSPPPSLFTSDKSKFRSKKNYVPKKLEISSPIAVVQSSTLDNPLRRLRPRK